MKRRLPRALLCVLPALFCAACVTTSGPPPRSTTKVNVSPRPMRPRHVASVALYRVKAPAQPFVEVAWLSRRGKDDVIAIAMLRGDAAEMGCDGIVLDGVADAATHENDYTGVFLNKHQYGPDHSATYVANARGTCIMFREDPGTWVAPAVVTNPRDCSQHWALFHAELVPDRQMKVLRKMPKRCKSHGAAG